jgi:hypothetical protein
MGKRGAYNLCQIKMVARHIFNERGRSAGQRSFAPIEWNGVTLKVVANKVEGERDVDFIKRQASDDYITAFGLSGYVRQMEKGVIGNLSEVEAENMAALETMLKLVDERKKDWNKFYRQAVEFHIKNAESWANAQLGTNVINQIDPAFNMEDMVNAQVKPAFMSNNNLVSEQTSMGEEKFHVISSHIRA